MRWGTGEPGNGKDGGNGGTLLSFLRKRKKQRKTSWGEDHVSVLGRSIHYAGSEKALCLTDKASPQTSEETGALSRIREKICTFVKRQNETLDALCIELCCEASWGQRF